MDTQERIDFADLVAQAVVDRIEQASNINMLVEMVLTRMAAIQRVQDGASSPAADAETSD